MLHTTSFQTSAKWKPSSQLLRALPAHHSHEGAVHCKGDSVQRGAYERFSTISQLADDALTHLAETGMAALHDNCTCMLSGYTNRVYIYMVQGCKTLVNGCIVLRCRERIQ